MVNDFINAVPNTSTLEAYRLVCKLPGGGVAFTTLYTVETLPAIADEVRATGAEVIDQISEAQYNELMIKRAGHKFAIGSRVSWSWGKAAAYTVAAHTVSDGKPRYTITAPGGVLQVNIAESELQAL